MQILHSANKNYTLLQESSQWIVQPVLLLLLLLFIANCKYKYLVCLLLTDANKNISQQSQIYIVYKPTGVRAYICTYVCLYVSMELFTAVLRRFSCNLIYALHFYEFNKHPQDTYISICLHTYIYMQMFACIANQRAFVAERAFLDNEHFSASWSVNWSCKTRCGGANANKPMNV